MKKAILLIHNFNFDKAFESFWFINWCISSPLCWLYVFGIKINAEWYDCWLIVSAAILGLFGIFTFAFPFIILFEIWEMLVNWAKK